MNEKFGIFIKISLKFVPKGTIDNWPGAEWATAIVWANSDLIHCSSERTLTNEVIIKADNVMDSNMARSELEKTDCISLVIQYCFTPKIPILWGAFVIMAAVNNMNYWALG